MNFEAKALSSEQNRNLLAQAKLRDLTVEIQENKQRAADIEAMSSVPRDDGKSSERVNPHIAGKLLEKVKRKRDV